MFLILLKYKKPLEIVNEHLKDHRAFLQQGYDKNFFIVSGPKKSREGGVILSQLKDKNELMSILDQDPFNIYDIADYEISEFDPVKFHPDFSCFI
ncbi:YciI family protein [Gammaproteobacteria bacterium]|nr:YciI family protein [Gammaproteobacteria bacterium]